MTQTPKELTDPPDRPQQATPFDLVTDALATIRLVGAIFLRAEYTAPWAYESPPPLDLAHILRPQAQQLVLFHIVEEGQFWIRLSSGEQLWASQGEVVVIPAGQQHIMGSADSVRPIAIASLLPPPPWEQFPVIRYGGGGARTRVVCGYLHCDDPVFTPMIGALPSLFSVRPAGPAAAWVTASIQYAIDASMGRSPAPSSVAVRLPELLFSEVLRLYVESSSPLGVGWLAALRDPIVGPALAALHAEPSRRWTVEELARHVACSRSTLNERFARLLKRAPMQYLSEWRLQLARGLLRETTLSVAAVAYQVGYESEEAFNRAFKRAMGKPPAQWRQRAASV